MESIRDLPSRSATVRVVALLAGLGLAVSGCRDTTGPQRGTIEATVSTAGEDIDPDGYTIVVGDSLSRQIGVNASATFPEVPAGNHEVRLAGVAGNCSLSGANPRTVTVMHADTVAVSMDVTCTRRVGDLEVSATTTGEDRDPDGYSVVVDGDTAASIGADGSVTLEGLAEGDHEITLSDVASNCTVSGTTPRTVGVPFDGTTSEAFEVSCVARVGNLEVSATTSGSDLDTDGYTVTVDGGNPASVSNNGSVLFHGLAEGDHQVRLSGVTDNCSVGSNPRTVSVSFGGTASTTFQVSCASPLPTGGKIAFHSDRDGDHDIYLMNPDGSGINQLTTHSGDDRKPALSRDRSKIAFWSTRSGSQDIWVMNADGSGKTNVTGLAGDEWYPAWSPDGSRVVFAYGPPGDRDLWVVNADGSGLKQLTSHPADETDPNWSPDGSKILFTSDRDGNEEIYVMNADGSNQVNLTNNAEGNQRDSRAEWHPSGSKIVWDTNRDGASAQIYVMDPDGTDQTRILSSTATDFDPSWSPDGGGIVFTRTQSGRKDILVMTAAGTNVTKLISNSGEDVATTWR